MITAIKALLHAHGAELFDLAQKNGCTICFEAALGDGIPVVAAMTQALTGNRILSIEAILNGTGNIILSRMLDDRQPYEAILAQAQALGFAEVDPTMDFDGTDAAQKSGGFESAGIWNTSHPRSGLAAGSSEARTAGSAGCVGTGVSSQLLPTSRLLKTAPRGVRDSPEPELVSCRPHPL